MAKKKVVKKPEIERKNNKELAHLFFREICAISCLLDNVCDGDIERLDELDPALAYLYLRLDDMIEWGDEKYNLLKESDNVEKYHCSKDFLKFHIPLCQDCSTDNMDYYMITEDLWDKYGCDDRMLCLDCLQKRMGRGLVISDFTNCIVNDECEFIQKLKKEILN